MQNVDALAHIVRLALHQLETFNQLMLGTVQRLRAAMRYESGTHAFQKLESFRAELFDQMGKVGELVVLFELAIVVVLVPVDTDVIVDGGRVDKQCEHGQRGTQEQ